MYLPIYLSSSRYLGNAGFQTLLFRVIGQAHWPLDYHNYGQRLEFYDGKKVNFEATKSRFSSQYFTFKGFVKRVFEGSNVKFLIQF